MSTRLLIVAFLFMLAAFAEDVEVVQKALAKWPEFSPDIDVLVGLDLENTDLAPFRESLLKAARADVDANDERVTHDCARKVSGLRLLYRWRATLPADEKRLVGLLNREFSARGNGEGLDFLARLPAIELLANLKPDSAEGLGALYDGILVGRFDARALSAKVFFQLLVESSSRLALVTEKKWLSEAVSRVVELDDELNEKEKTYRNNAKKGWENRVAAIEAGRAVLHEAARLAAQVTGKAVLKAAPSREQAAASSVLATAAVAKAPVEVLVQDADPREKLLWPSLSSREPARINQAIAALGDFGLLHSSTLERLVLMSVREGAEFASCRRNALQLLHAQSLLLLDAAFKQAKKGNGTAFHECFAVLSRLAPG